MDAIGLLAYLLSLPHDWVVYKTTLHLQMDCGKTKLDGAFKELQATGFILSVRKQKSNGKIEYEHIVYDKPYNGEPLTEKPYTEKPSTVNQTLLNTNIESTDKQSKEEKNKKLEFGDFTEICNRWLKYKSDRKEKYVSDDSIQTFVKKLIKLSDNNPVKANLIIEQSIANNWAGIFELKQQAQSQQTDKNKMVY